MKQLFLSLILVLIFKMGYADTNTTIGTDTIMGTETVGTMTTPVVESQIYSIRVVSAKPEYKAGEPLDLQVVANWTNGSQTQIVKGLQWQAEGTITDAGVYKVTCKYKDWITSTDIKIIPAELIDFQIIPAKNIPYGMWIPVNSLCSVIGYDKYKNAISGIEYNIAIKLNGISFFAQKLGTKTIRIGMQIITADALSNGVMINSAKREILLYDNGIYNGTIEINGIQKQFTFKTNFQPINIPHTLVEVDIDNCYYTVKYLLNGESVQKRFTIPHEWIDKFMTLNIYNCLEVICWMELAIDEEARKIQKNMMYQAIENVFKPLIGK
ncbi:MAG: hypothetical protein AB1414_18435 [bacterium]